MTATVGYLLLFTVVGAGFVFVNLMVGKMLRPAKMNAEKGTIYECGEPTIGSAWVQFDLRFYVVALLFVIFDVETIFLFPWAIIYKQLALFGLIEMMVFLGILIVGYIWIIKKGALDWA